VSKGSKEMNRSFAGTWVDQGEGKGILLVGPSPPPFGGARVSFALFYEWIDENLDLAVDYHDLPVRRNGRGSEYRRVDHVRTLWAALRIINRIRYCSRVVIFCSSGFAFSYGLMIIVSSHLMRRPCSLRLFGGHPGMSLRSMLFLRRKLINCCLKMVDKIVVQTEAGKGAFPDEIQERVKVVFGYRRRNERFTVLNTQPSRCLRFVYCGQVSIEKGSDTLLQAWGMMNEFYGESLNCELAIYGPCPVKSPAFTLDIDKVHYYGEVPSDKIPEILSEADVFVFPSRYKNEGHSGAVIEALFAGLAIVASALPCLKEVIQSGYNGVLIDDVDGAKLFKVLSNLYENPSEIARLGMAAIASSERFDHQLVIPELCSELAI
jgi:glycosyltransferase involved in cell wall biosynthesis